MKAVYVQKGESLDFINVTDSPVNAGDVVVFGEKIGVAATLIPPGGMGSIHMVGVFEIPKKSGEAIAVGTSVFFTEEGISASPASAPAVSQVDSESGGGAAASGGSSAPVGYAVADAASDDASVKIKLMG